MSVFTPKNRETFYCRITIPLRLWPLVNSKEVWRSLQTTDKDLAEVRAEKWKTSGKRLFLILKREGHRMNKQTIDDRVQRWLDELLDEEVPWHEQRYEDLADYAEFLHEQRLEGRWNQMTEQADTSWAWTPVTWMASGMPLASTRTWTFEPHLRRSVGFGPVFSPPLGAFVVALSTSARDQSILSAPLSSAKSIS